MEWRQANGLQKLEMQLKRTWYFFKGKFLLLYKWSVAYLWKFAGYFCLWGHR